MTIRLAVLLALGMVAPGLAQSTGGPAGTYYIVTTPLTAYAKPDGKSGVVDKIAPLTYVGVRKGFPAVGSGSRFERPAQESSTS